MQPNERSLYRLQVEGNDDKWSIINLLRRHGYNWDDPSQLRPFVEVTESVEQLLAAIPVAVKSRYLRLGFVLDADIDQAQRWLQVQGQLRRAGLEVPEQADPTGVIVEGMTPDRRIGVWLMPDNRHPGNLESFLATLVPAGDVCWPHAQQSTHRAITLGARLQPKDLDKGALYAWLAWQEKPGLPFGTALTAHVLGHDSPEASSFVAWFDRLFGP